MTLHSPADVTFTPSFPDDFHQSNEAVPVHHRILHDSLPTDLKISMVPIQLPHLPNRHMPQTSEVWWTWRRMALPWSICLYSPIMGQFNNNESPGHAMMPLTGSHQPKKISHVYTYSPIPLIRLMSLESMYLTNTNLNPEWRLLRGQKPYLGLVPICSLPPT